MKKINKIDYWINSSENDWKVASHLLEKGDYAYEQIEEMKTWLLQKMQSSGM